MHSDVSRYGRFLVFIGNNNFYSPQPERRDVVVVVVGANTLFLRNERIFGFVFRFNRFAFAIFYRLLSVACSTGRL